jgi:hypothetical protein
MGQRWRSRKVLNSLISFMQTDLARTLLTAISTKPRAIVTVVTIIFHSHAVGQERKVFLLEYLALPPVLGAIG